MSRIALLAALLIAAAPQDDASKDTARKLKTIRLDVDFKDTDIRQFVDYVREVTGFNIVISKSVKFDFIKLTIKAKGVSVQSLFNLLLKPHEIGYTIEEGIIVIQDQAAIRSNVRLEIIDVRDLLYPIRDFPGVEITLVDTGLASISPVDDVKPELPLVDLIKAHVGGKSWEDNPRASIQLVNGLLFVRQSDEVIQQIRRILASFRHFK
jgi:type II secretory pathway component GspD/PulD (secretin)